jgi:hypothetical protein
MVMAMRHAVELWSRNPFCPGWVSGAVGDVDLSTQSGIHIETTK